eukprot:gene9613-biopygen12770
MVAMPQAGEQRGVRFERRVALRPVDGVVVVGGYSDFCRDAVFGAFRVPNLWEYPTSEIPALVGERDHEVGAVVQVRLQERVEPALGAVVPDDDGHREAEQAGERHVRGVVAVLVEDPVDVPHHVEPRRVDVDEDPGAGVVDDAAEGAHRIEEGEYCRARDPPGDEPRASVVGMRVEPADHILPVDAQPCERSRAEHRAGHAEEVRLVPGRAGVHHRARGAEAALRRDHLVGRPVADHRARELGAAEDLVRAAAGALVARGERVRRGRAAGCAVGGEGLLRVRHVPPELEQVRVRARREARRGELRDVRADERVADVEDLRVAVVARVREAVLPRVVVQRGVRPPHAVVRVREHRVPVELEVHRAEPPGVNRSRASAGPRASCRRAQPNHAALVGRRRGSR